MAQLKEPEVAPEPDQPEEEEEEPEDWPAAAVPVSSHNQPDCHNTPVSLFVLIMFTRKLYLNLFNTVLN